MSRRVGLGQRGPLADDPEDDQAEASPLSQLIANKEGRSVKVVANVVAFLDFKGVEALSTLCHAAATDGPPTWWRSTLETWITNSEREFERKKPNGARALRKLEAELAQDMYDLSLTGDAWEARRGLYVELYFWSKVTATPTFIEPPPSCGEDRFDIFRDDGMPGMASDHDFLHTLGVWAYPPFWAPRLRTLARSARGLNCAVTLGSLETKVARAHLSAVSFFPGSARVVDALNVVRDRDGNALTMSELSRQGRVTNCIAGEAALYYYLESRGEHPTWRPENVDLYVLADERIDGLRGVNIDAISRMAGTDLTASSSRRWCPESGRLIFADGPAQILYELALTPELWPIIDAAEQRQGEDIRESACFLGGRIRVRTILVGSAIDEPGIWGFGPDARPPAQEANVQRVLDAIPVDVLRIGMRIGTSGEFDFEMSDDVRAAIAARHATIAPDVAAAPIKLQRLSRDLRTLALAGFTIVGAPPPVPLVRPPLVSLVAFADVIELDVKGKPLEGSLGLLVAEYVDPGTLASLCAATRPLHREFSKRWPRTIKHFVASSGPWATILSRTCLGNVPRLALARYLKSPSFAMRHFVDELAFETDATDFTFDGARRTTTAELVQQVRLAMGLAGSFALHGKLRSLGERPRWPPGDLDFYAVTHGPVTGDFGVGDITAVRLPREVWKRRVSLSLFDQEWDRNAPFTWLHTKTLSVNTMYPPPSDGLSPVAVYDVELELRCLDAGGRACSLSTSAVSFIQLAAASLAKCSIQAVIDSFDINVCAVGMLPRGFGEVDYILAPEVEQAIRSKTMRLRPQHNTTPGRVEKYQSRGFTLLE